MAEQSSIHAYLDWTKQRVDEMDAAVASLEIKTRDVTTEARARSEQCIANLKKQRDEFQAKARAQVEAGEASLRASKAQLEAQWNRFEAELKGYFDTIGDRIDQQQTTFRKVAAAQAKAWQETADELHAEAAKAGDKWRADIENALTRIKADGSEAQARLQNLQQAGSTSWAALSAALAESRLAFDRATQQAWEAVKRAAPPAP